MKTSPAALTILLLAVSFSLAAQDEKGRQLIDDSKKMFDFKSWPGRDGDLKPGFRFVPTEYPQLAGFGVQQDRVELEQVDHSFVSKRAVDLVKDSEKVSVQIQVSQDKTEVVHLSLLLSISQTQLHPLIANPRGDLAGIQVGDLNFIDNCSDATKPRVIRFARNNILVTLGKPAGSLMDLPGLAAAIDARIKSAPDLKPKALKAMLPAIQAFDPVKKSISPFASTPITLTTADPQGLKLKVRLTADLGRIARDESVNPPTTTFSSQNETGKATIDVQVINEALLFATEQTTVMIK